MEIITTDVVSYKTALVSSLHLSTDNVQQLLRMSADPVCWFAHSVCEGAENAFILRFKAMAGGEWEDIEDVLKEHDFDTSFISLVVALANADYDAIHFDRDADLVPGADFYVDGEGKARPLAYSAEIIRWYDLSEEQQRTACAEWLPDEYKHGEEFFGENGDAFFDVEGDLYYMGECLSLSDSDVFDGYFSVSAFCSINVKLSNDSDFVDVFRVTW